MDKKIHLGMEDQLLAKVATALAFGLLAPGFIFLMPKSAPPFLSPLSISRFLPLPHEPRARASSSGI